MQARIVSFFLDSRTKILALMETLSADRQLNDQRYEELPAQGDDPEPLDDEQFHSRYTNKD